MIGLERVMLSFCLAKEQDEWTEILMELNKRKIGYTTTIREDHGLITIENVYGTSEIGKLLQKIGM